MEKIAPPQAALPVLDSPTYSPMFKFKMELRAPYFDPTAIALISVETIDKSNDEVRIVGYCAMNLFINSKTKEPPKSEAVQVIKTYIKLTLGCYSNEWTLSTPYLLPRTL
jgi:hypothetical protein